MGSGILFILHLNADTVTHRVSLDFGSLSLGLVLFCFFFCFDIRLLFARPEHSGHLVYSLSGHV